MLYLLLFVVFSLVFLIPLGIGFFGRDGSRTSGDGILVGLFAGLASVGLAIGCIAVPLVFAPEILASGVGWLAVFGGVIAIPAAVTKVTRGWLRR